MLADDYALVRKKRVAILAYKQFRMVYTVDGQPVQVLIDAVCDWTTVSATACLT